MASSPAPAGAGSRETLYAIIGSFVVSLILATLLTGNPFRSLGAAYHDYGQTKAAGQPAASDTHAPATK